MPTADSYRRVDEGSDDPNWTLLVYMAAENSSELDSLAVADLREMEQGANEHTNVVVQINRAWPTLPQRYVITPNRSELVGVAEDRDMGREATLTSFLTWAVNRFPARHYALVLWGHAFGLGFGRDHNNPLTLKELATALENFRCHRPGNRKLDLLGANACAMSYVEAAYELRDGASYMVASQIAVPFAGWPYKTILSRIDATTTPPRLGTQIVDAYVTHYNALVSGERVQMSRLTLDEANILPAFLKTLAGAVRSETMPEGQFSSDRLDYVRDVFRAAACGEVRPLIDLRDLCRGFSAAKGAELKALSRKDGTSTLDSLVYSRAHPDLEDLRGLGIFVPFVTDQYDLKRLGLEDTAADEGGGSETGREGAEPRKSGREEYGDLEIFKDSGSQWPQLVYEELRREIPSELMTSLTAIGATSVADRRDIAQIVLSIDASFNKLDDVLADARACVKEGLTDASEHARKSNSPDPQGEPARPSKNFGRPWLALIREPDLATRVGTLKLLDELRTLEQRAGVRTASYIGARLSDAPAAPATPPGALVDSVVDFFMRVEKAVGEVERATRKGLTNAKFGLGPANPNQFNIALGDISEQPKSELGDISEQPKSELGDISEQPKSELGPSVRRSAGGVIRRGDLRVDLAFARVGELFSDVGGALRQLEEATLQVETVARSVLIDAQMLALTGTDLLEAAGGEIDRGFRMLQEAATNARRTVRRVLAHPVYGMGPASGAVSLDDRQALAAAGGLDRSRLRLL